MPSKTNLEKYQDKINKKIEMLMPFLHRAALGDFNKTIKVSADEDEFTELFISINVMIEDLKDIQAENNENIEKVKLAKEECDKEVHLKTKELQNKEQKYRSLVEGIEEGIYRMELPSGKYSYASPSIEKVFGYTAKQLIDNDLLIKKMIHSDSMKYFKEKWNNLSVGIVDESYDYKIIDPKGKERWIRQSNNGIYDENKKLIGIEGVCRNVTKERKVKVELKKEKEFLQNVLDTTQTIVLVLDTEGKIQFVNKYFEQLSGYNLKQIQGKSWFKEFLMVKDVKTVKQVFKKALTQKRTQGNINLIKIKDSKTVSIEWFDDNMKDENGNIIGLLAVGRNVTEKLKIENKLKESEERFSLAMQGANDGVWDWDIIKNTVFFSDRWKTMLGFEPEEIKDDFSEWVRLMHADDKEKTLNYVQNFIKSKHSGSFEMEFRMITKKKTYVDILARAFVARDSKGKAKRMVGTHIDITERKKNEELLIDQ